jgi:choline transport protein
LVGISLTEASAAGTLWSLPIAGAMTLVVAAGMAKLASAYPVAGSVVEAPCDLSKTTI